MFPTIEQIRTAAYHRWERRGRVHGHDREDWRAAEQDLLFQLNYQILSHYRLDEPELRELGRRRPRVCRYCERAAPRATFTDPIRPIPEVLGNRSLVTLDECDECHAQFTEGILADFVEFARPFFSSEPLSKQGTIPVSACKGLTKMALGLLPEAELEYVPDTIEWVSNPDHDTDLGTFAELGCYLHVLDSAETPFAALARRIEDEVPFPYLLFFLGTSGVVFQSPIPLCVRDEDQEVGSSIVPTVALPFEPFSDPGEIACVFLPMASTEAHRPVRTQRL